MWSVHENQTRNEPRGKDSLLKKQGQENWPPTRKNIREGHPLGYPTEIQLKTHHLHLELSPPPALPPPKCAEMDLRSALSWTQETSTSSSFSPLAAPPYRRALRQPHSSQPGCSPVTPEPKPWGPWGDKAPAREEWAAPRSQTSEGSPRSSSAVSTQTGGPNWNGAQWPHNPPQNTAKEQSEPGWNAAIQRNTFESVLRKGMHRERIKQASQSEREKHGIEKDGSDESVHISALETQT